MMLIKKTLLSPVIPLFVAIAGTLVFIYAALDTFVDRISYAQNYAVGQVKIYGWPQSLADQLVSDAWIRAFQYDLPVLIAIILLTAVFCYLIVRLQKYFATRSRSLVR